MSRPPTTEGKLSGSCFVDTSAFYALLDAEDPHHPKSVGLFTQLARSRARLLTSNHVIFETYSLVLSRLGRWMALMERLRLRQAIAFDSHFRQYGQFIVLH